MGTGWGEKTGSCRLLSWMGRPGGPLAKPDLGEDLRIDALPGGFVPGVPTEGAEAQQQETQLTGGRSLDAAFVLG